MLRWTVIATFALGCGHAAPAAGPPPGTSHASPADAQTGDTVLPALAEDFPRLADRSVKMYEELARAVAEPNCAAATKKINAVADAYADVIAAARRVIRAGRDQVKQLRAALDPHQAELDASAAAIAQAPTMTKCSQDPAFSAAMDRFQEPS